MFVDKRLAGIQAVPSLSRLNRIHPLKEDTFVLDFVNEREEIREAFKTYYEGAEMGEEVDPARMYAIKGELEASGIYLDEEVERFSAVYFKPKQRQSALDHQAMNAALDPAVSRFTVRQNDDEEEAELWRGKVQAFLNLYGFLSQVIPHQDSDLERLYVFLRHLAAKLHRRKSGPAYQFEDEVRLEYYRLQKISEGSISLQEGDARRLDGPTEVGSGLVRPQPMPLSRPSAACDLACSWPRWSASRWSPPSPTARTASSAPRSKARARARPSSFNSATPPIPRRDSATPSSATAARRSAPATLGVMGRSPSNP